MMARVSTIVLYATIVYNMEGMYPRMGHGGWDSVYRALRAGGTGVQILNQPVVQ